jgi:hypothetical protein
MNHVVSFLSLLCVDEKNSSIKRMLTVCSEFERIARVVLDKAEKESSSRRKRKQQEHRDASVDSTAPTTHSHHSASPSTIHSDGETPKPSQPGNIPNVFSPPDYAKYLSDNNFQNLSNLTSNLSSAMQDLGQGTPAMANWLSPRQIPTSSLPNSTSSSATAATFEFSTSPSANASNRTSLNSTLAPPASNGAAVSMAGPQNVDPLEMGNSFAHPFIPQDLWQMPMTLEWDWADMTAGSGLFGAAGGAGGDGAFDDGLGMNGVLNDVNRTPGKNEA